MLTGENFVGYIRSAKSHSVFQTFNPVKNGFLPTCFAEATDEEIDKASNLAQEAYDFLSQQPFLKRAIFLRKIILEMNAAKVQILEYYCLESGLSKDRAAIEFQRTINQIELFADYIEKGSFLEVSIDTGDLNRIPPKPDLRKKMVGIGPVLVFGASNFPLAYSTVGGDTISAFAAGCPVIVKSHPMHAGTGELVAQCVVNAAKSSEMPNGVFSNLNGKSFDVGQKLVLHPMIKAVGFTGSHLGGRQLFDLASKRKEPIPVFAEMGSVNPIIILPEAILLDRIKWVERIAFSVTNDAGQFCTKPGILFVPKIDEVIIFAEELKQEILRKSNVSMLHPDILNRYKKRLDEVANCIGVHQEISLSNDDRNEGPNAISESTIIDFLNSERLHEEVFGPHLLVVEFDSLSDVLAGIDKLGGQLTCTLIGSEKEFLIQKEVINVIQRKTGRLIFNGVPTGVEVNASSNHGGPYPATTDSRFTAVGEDAIKRFVRPVVLQNCPDELLPIELKNKNLLHIMRRVNGILDIGDVID
jgi:alpha-ketoglutaric semialdehyde dehydrogenase